MANLRIGMRVRVIAEYPNDIERLVGREGVITFHEPRHFDFIFGVSYPWRVELIGIGERRFAADQLAPLLDPRASDLIADLERFAHLAAQERQQSVRVLADSEVDKVTGGKS